ncbi:kinesin-13A-like [Cucumis melo var. makuwa]|uniref:Kinesin-13A-like n=1 Tax=Cucumis melo var. makuwa TaxID=1194695 RepID=A0A5D3CC04_CUCMM|nr:kinesin-13A-like [Cucumis melo var. makuwa]TYK09351.1 kinesin-13A-like [Cucumis melo var. makuwa]
MWMGNGVSRLRPYNLMKELPDPSNLSKYEATTSSAATTKARTNTSTIRAPAERARTSFSIFLPFVRPFPLFVNPFLFIFAKLCLSISVTTHTTSLLPYFNGEIRAFGKRHMEGGRVEVTKELKKASLSCFSCFSIATSTFKLLHEIPTDSRGHTLCTFLNCQGRKWLTFIKDYVCGPWHLGGKPMLLRKWTPGIVPESFVFNSIPVWIKLGRIPMKLWREAELAVVASLVGKPITLDLATKEQCRLSYAHVCVELDVDSCMHAKITVNLRGVDFIVSLEESEIRSSTNRPSRQVEKEVGKRDEFTLVTRKKRDLVCVRDRGKSLEVTMPNSFGSLLKAGNIDKWALTIVKGSPLPLSVNDGVVALSGYLIFWGRPLWGSVALWRLEFAKKKNRFSFSTRVVDEQFVIVQITSGWSSSRVVMGDLNAIRVHSEAFGGSPIQGEMEDFDMAIRDADLMEPSNGRVVSFWFFNHWVKNLSFIEVGYRMWGRHEGTSSASVRRCAMQRRPWIVLKERLEEAFFVRSPGFNVDLDDSMVSFHDGVFRWSEKCYQGLQVPISRGEVRRVLFSMDSGKAPGPDGFSVGFFKGVNATAITLIPKCVGLSVWRNFDLFLAVNFVDDLMIFCAADEPSLSFVRETLQKFGELSYLFAKLGKSSIFVVGGSNEATSSLAANMGFVLGNLPVRYLGLPLLTGSVLVLPAFVHNNVDKILRSYLWRGKDEVRGGVKVAWVEVCLPFEEGGLAIRDEPSWNIAIDSGVGRSWCLQAILHKQDSLKQHVQMEIGERVLYDEASQREARFSEFIGLDGEWQWPRGGFFIANAWDTIHPQGGRVRWACLLWSGRNVPKHSFCAWLAIKDRGMFGLGSLRSWLPLIGLRIKGLSCLGFVIKEEEDELSEVSASDMEEVTDMAKLDLNTTNGIGHSVVKKVKVSWKNFGLIMRRGRAQQKGFLRTTWSSWKVVKEDRLPLPLGGVDLILGMQWQRTLGVTEMDW